MAGIGFRLQKLLDEGTYSSSVRAYAYSALIAAGPFLLTVLVVALIRLLSYEALSEIESTYFQALVTYAYAFSLIGVGGGYLVVTRYIADEYYRGNVGGFTAVYFSSVSVFALGTGPLVLWHASRLGVPGPVRLMSLLLYLFVGTSWIALVFLSAAKEYARIARAFVIGAAVGLGTAYWLGPQRGLAGYFGGFVLGQGLVVLLLSRAILDEFDYWEPRNHHWLHYFRKHPWLIGVGLFYNLGVWVDKFLFWFSREGLVLDRGLRFCPFYDMPLFLSYLTIVPSLTYFLVRMETSFSTKYQDYYLGIQRQESLQRLEARRQDILRCLADNFQRLLLLQGILSGLALLAVPWLTQVLGLDPLQMGVLRVGIFASFLQGGLLVVVNILLYFDHQKDAFITTAVFCAGNALFTAATLRSGLVLYGFGYALACLVGLVVGLSLLNERLRRLHYWTFMLQPMPRPILVEEDNP
jgi:uncharacterized membrane protein